MSRSALWRATLFLALPLAFPVIHVGVARAQRPTAAVAERVDVSGDGRPDEVRIDADGSITVHITGDDAAGAWTPLAASGKVVGGSIVVDTKVAKGKTIILATSKLGRRGGRSFTEAVALAWSPGRLETLWRGKLGAQGADGSSSLSLELGPYGLIKYSNRAGVSRCDGEVAHLDAERYDFASGRFRPAQQALRMSAADQRPSLVASPSAPGFLAPDATAFWFRATGASSSSTARSAAELVAPTALADGNDATAWVENKGGPGAGEFVTLESSVGEVQVRALRLALGHGAARKEFGRPKRIGLILGSSEKFWVDIPKDPRKAQWVVLPTPIPSKCITLVLDKVHPRRALPQTAISEVTVFSSEESDPKTSASLLASRIASGRAGADTRRLLSRLGAGASGALLSAISTAQREASPTTSQQVANLRLALASIPAGPVELVAGLANDGLRSAQHSVFSQALLKLHSESIAPLTQTLLGQAISPAATGRIANVLSSIPEPQASDALLGALGNGTTATRSQIVHALASRPSAWRELPAANVPENTAATQADLFRAMGMAGDKLAAGSKKRAALARSISTSVSQPGLGYEEHYRALTAAGQLGGSKLVIALSASFERLQDREDPEGLALLRRSAASLGRSAQAEELSKEHTASLEAALAHSDPGVRLAVLSALDADAAIAKAIAMRLDSDGWPEVRRAAAATLSARCTPSNVIALEKATRTDSNAKVARSAFAGFLGCAPKNAFALASSLVDNTKRPLALRLHAARLLGELASDADSSLVVKRFAKSRRLALGNSTSGKMASALTRALADLGTPEAVQALESSAGDPAFPMLQTAAINALGTLCPASSTQLLRQLASSNEHSVSNAASMASRQCSVR